jgi:hypothetical protein
MLQGESRESRWDVNSLSPEFAYAGDDNLLDDNINTTNNEADILQNSKVISLEVNTHVTFRHFIFSLR